MSAQLEKVNPNLTNYPRGTPGLWTVHNKRYDLRSFVNSHPGGRNSILQGQGRNCTVLFEAYHSLATRDVNAVLKKYFVEDAHEGDPDYDASYSWEPDSPGGKFWTVLKSRVKQHFESKKMTHKATTTQLAIQIIFCLLFFVSMKYYLMGYWWAVIAMPLLYFVTGTSNMHDGNHYSISRHSWVNTLAAIFGSGVCSPYWWSLKHNVGHHEYTNIKGKDGDLTGLTAIAAAPNQRVRKFLTIMPAIATFHLSFINEMQYKTLTPRNEFKEMGTFPIVDKIFHYVSRVVLYCFLVYPFTVFPAWKALLMLVIPYAIHGECFFTLSQLSHLNTLCFKEDEMLEPPRSPSNPDSPSPSPSSAEGSEGKETQGEKVEHWVINQLEHTLDWGYNSKFLGFLTVGLCYQTIHHLFPQVYSQHLAEIQPIVVKTCKEFGIRYNWVPTADDAVKLHIDLFRYYEQPSIIEFWYHNQGPVCLALKGVARVLGVVPSKTNPDVPKNMAF